MINIPDSALNSGFTNALVGTHTCRTMMLKELSLLLSASSPETEFEEYRELVVEENLTLKTTLATKKKTFRHLQELYGLKTEVLIFRALRDMWDASADERPLLALLCAVARDPLLRSTSTAVIPVPAGNAVTSAFLAEAIQNAYPDHYQPDVAARTSRNALSSWTQSGHVSGKVRKIRSYVNAGPASTAYALFMGYLCGVRGTLLFETYWTKLLDCSAAMLDTHAFSASQRGWLDYRRMGDVADISFNFLMRDY